MDEIFGLFNNTKLKSKKITSINDISALIIFTRKCMDEGDFVGALGSIKRLLTAVKTKEEHNNCYYLMSRLYADLRIFSMSVNCAFRLLKNCDDEAIPFAEFLLGASFLGLGDTTAARYYLNSCLNSAPNSDISDSALECMQQINLECGHGLKVVGGTDYKQQTRDNELKNANLLLAAGQNEEAMERLLELNAKNITGASSSLALCHFFMGDVKKAIEVTKNVRKMSVFDQCNLIIFYDALLDFESQKKIIDEIANRHGMACEEYLKLGITFAQIKRNDLVMKYLGMYLKYVDHDPEILLFYAISCLNCCEKENAKEALLTAQAIDMANGYIYKYYLNLAHFGMKYDLEYVIDIQNEERTKVNKRVSEMSGKSAAQFKKLIDLDFLDYVIRHDDVRGRGALLLRVATQINSKEMDAFWEGVLLDVDVDTNIKYIILRARLLALKDKKFAVTINGIYSWCDIGAVFALKKLIDENFLEGVVLAQMYAFQQEMGGDVSLKITKDDILNYIKAGEKEGAKKPLKYALAAVFAHRACKDSQQGLTPKKLSKHFLIKEEDFWAAQELFGDKCED